MPLELLSPAKTGRKFWYLRGTHCGKRHFFSTKRTKDPTKENKNFIRDAEKEIERGQHGLGRMTFATAAQRYIEFKNPKKHNRDWVERICQHIGHAYVDEIVQFDLVKVANDIYGHTVSPATKNRTVLTPGGAVLHYAAKQKWCKWVRVEKFTESAAKTRYVGGDVEGALHKGLRMKGTRWKANKRLLIMWLFRQGDRISDALRVKFEDCDLERMTVYRLVSKNNTFQEFPLDETIARYLRRKKGEGYIFKWQDQHSANRWISRLCKRLDINFTPHMARHTVGKRLNDSGAGLKTIMQKLGQIDPKSAIRYQTTDIETVRRASKVLR